MKTSTKIALATLCALLIAAGIIVVLQCMRVPRYRYKVLAHARYGYPDLKSEPRDEFAFLIETEHMGRFSVYWICEDLMRHHCTARCTIQLWDRRDAYRSYIERIRDMPFSRLIYYKDEYIFTADHYVAESSNDGEPHFAHYPLKDDMQYTGWTAGEGIDKDTPGK